MPRAPWHNTRSATIQLLVVACDVDHFELQQLNHVAHIDDSSRAACSSRSRPAQFEMVVKGATNLTCLFIIIFAQVELGRSRACLASPSMLRAFNRSKLRDLPHSRLPWHSRGTRLAVLKRRTSALVSSMAFKPSCASMQRPPPSVAELLLEPYPSRLTHQPCCQCVAIWPGKRLLSHICLHHHRCFVQASRLASGSSSQCS